MPLKDFIEETMKLLATDAKEIVVQQAQPFRNNPGPNESVLVDAVQRFDDRRWVNLATPDLNKSRNFDRYPDSVVPATAKATRTTSSERGFHLRS